MSLLEVENLKVHFPVSKGSLFRRDRRVVKAVDGVSFHLSEGETLGLVGESGCGKSTTGRALMRLVKSTEGSIRFEGEDITLLKDSSLKEFRKKVQMVFQNPYSSLNPRMTVSRIIEEPLRALTSMNGKQRLTRIKEVLQEVNLSEKFINRYPHEFSGGQRQRINIARALAVRPKLIVADEPVSALDVSIQAQIINLLLDLQEKYQLALIFIAHDLSVVKALSHRIAVMYLGRMVEISETESLYTTPKHPYTQSLLASVPVADPRIEKQRIFKPLTGDIPSPINPPSGCTFHPRCPKAKDRCRSEAPQMRLVEHKTWASCHYVD